MIARWKERTGRSPPDCLYSKTCRRARSPPFSVGCSQCGVLPGFLSARGHGQRVNQLEPEPRSFCSFSARPSIKPPLHPLPCSSFGLFFCHFFFHRLSPLWYSPPLHVRGKNGFKRSISDSLPARFSAFSSLNRLDPERDPQVVSAARKGRGEGEGDGNGGGGGGSEWTG